VAQWSPAQWSGVAGWWRADSLTLTDGAAVASWSDKSGNGNTLTQATGAQQPVFKVGAGASGMNGQPVVHFTAASSTLLTKATPTGLPASIAANGGKGFSVLAVFRPTSSVTHAMFVGYNPAASSGGWHFELTSNALDFTTETRLDYLFARSAFSTDKSPSQGTAVFNPDFSADGNINNRYSNSGVNYDSHVTGSADVAGTPTLLSIGGLGYTGAASAFLDGDIAEIVILNRPLTQNDRNIWARYCSQRYGCPAGNGKNAANYLTIPTPAADNIVTEPCVVDLGSSDSSGHRYRMVMTPLTGQNVANENPCIVWSSDKVTWTVPPGVTNPIVPARATGNNSDPSLVFQAGTYYLFYKVENDPTLANNGVWLTTSTDFVTWTTPARVIAETGATAANDFNSPNAVYDSILGLWVMFTCNTSSSLTTLDRRTAAAPVGPWTLTDSTVLPFPQAPARTCWHANVQIDAVGIYRMLIVDNDGNRNLWGMSSADGLSWSAQAWPVLRASYTGWDNASIYRAAFSLDDSGLFVNVWYAAVNAGGVHHTGYTQVEASAFP
jgi:hypothetical protein